MLAPSGSLLRAGIYLAGWDLGTLLRFGRLQSTRPRTKNPTPLCPCTTTSETANRPPGRAQWMAVLARAPLSRLEPALQPGLFARRIDTGRPVPPAAAAHAWAQRAQRAPRRDLC
mgnify:CR=1 FL=1